jgi:sRNA-binding protein
MAARAASRKDSPALGRRQAKGSAALVAAFPTAFNRDNPMPLSRGVCEQILASPKHGMNKHEVRAALRTWCHRPAYLRALVSGTVRIDLQGNPVGEVLLAERLFAREQLRRFGDGSVDGTVDLLDGKRDPQATRDLQRYADDLRATGRTQAQIAEELGLTARQVSKLIAGHRQFVEDSRALVRFCDDQLLNWAQEAPTAARSRVLAFIGGGSDYRLWQLLQALRDDLLLIRKLGAPTPEPLPPVIASEFLGTDAVAAQRLAPLAAAAWAGRTKLILCVNSIDDLERLGISPRRCAVLQIQHDLVSATFSDSDGMVRHPAASGADKAAPKSRIKRL